MKIKQILTLLLCALSTNLFSQTKLISHKSHSGSSINFKTVLENNLFNNDCSNYGDFPDRYVNEARLDSLIFISDSTAIMVTSQYCKRMYRDEKFTKWRAGRELVFKHPLFSRQHSLDSIKSTLKKEYYFRNPIEKVKFVGYDNVKPKVKIEKKDTLILSEPLIAKGQNDPEIKSRKIHKARESFINNDIIWLVEIISLVTMAAGVTLVKLR